MSEAGFFLLLVALGFAPLAFGAVEPWSLMVVTLLAALALTATCLGRRGSWYRTPGGVPLLALLTFAGLQLLPLPQGLLAVIAPQTLAVQLQALGGAETGSWFPLSLHPKATWAEWVRLAACAAVYVAAVQLLAERRLLRRAVVVSLVVVVAVALLGLVQYLTWNGKLYWVRELTRGGAPFGPFVNRNHYAGYAGMMLPLVLVLFHHYRPRVHYGGLRERVVEALGDPGGNLHLLLGAAALLLAVTIFLSCSRSGIVAATLGTGVLGLALALRAGNLRGALSVAGFALAVLLAVGWFGWDSVLIRFGSLGTELDATGPSRVGYWRDTLALARDFPWFGSGVGTFADVYPAYRTVPGTAQLTHAHNDYLELLAEGGVVGVALAGWFLAAVVGSVVRTLRRRHEPYCLHLGFGVLAGLATWLIHGVTDFNLHIGSNALQFSFLLAVAVAAAHTRLRGGGGSLLPQVPRGRLVSSAVALGLLLLGGGYHAGDLHGRGLLAAAAVQDGAGLPALAGSVPEPGQWLDPLEAEHYWVASARALVAGREEEAVAAALAAVRLQPTRAQGQQRLARLYQHLERPQPAAAALLQAQRLAPAQPAVYRDRALWLAAQGQGDAASGEFRRALERVPEQTRDYLTLMLTAGLSGEQITGAVPEHALAQLEYGDHLAETGRRAAADHHYRRALVLAPAEEAAGLRIFFRVAHRYRSEQRLEEAVEVLRRAAEHYPAVPSVRIHLGRLYLRLDIPYRAVEEYQRALYLDPRQREARRVLARLQAR